MLETTALILPDSYFGRKNDMMHVFKQRQVLSPCSNVTCMRSIKVVEYTSPQFEVYILWLDVAGFSDIINNVNVLGSFFIGGLYIYLSERPELSEASRHLLITGFLGALTTFSTFSLETLLLIEQGHYNTALFNVLSSVMFCLGSAYLGISLAKAFL